jgi:hypothetical protein
VAALVVVAVVASAPVAALVVVATVLVAALARVAAVARVAVPEAPVVAVERAWGPAVESGPAEAAQPG